MLGDGLVRGAHLAREFETPGLVELKQMATDAAGVGTRSTGSTSPSTCARTLSGSDGILRTSSAPASVPSSQPPMAAIM